MSERRLSTNVWVGDKLYVSGSVPPSDISAQMGDHCFETEVKTEPAVTVVSLFPTRVEAPSPSSGGADGPPPLHGKGSSTDSWAAYASVKGVHVSDGAGRGEILEALQAAGVPTGDE